MKEIKRYDLEAWTTSEPQNGEMFEKADGDYVEYEDVEKLLQQLAEANEIVEEMAIALDTAQAYIRKLTLPIDYVLETIDKALKNSPVKLEKL